MPWSEADLSPQSRAQVRREWSYASVSLYAFMACTGKYALSLCLYHFFLQFYRISFQFLSFARSIVAFNLPSSFFFKLEKHSSTYRSQLQILSGSRNNNFHGNFVHMFWFSFHYTIKMSHSLKYLFVFTHILIFTACKDMHKNDEH